MDKKTTKKLKSIQKEAYNLKNQKNYEDAVRKFREGITYLRLNIKEYDEREAEVDKIVEEIDRTYSKKLNDILNKVKELLDHKKFDDAHKMLKEATEVNENISNSELKNTNARLINFNESEVELRELIEQGIQLKSDNDFDKALIVFQKALDNAKDLYKKASEIKEINEIKNLINQTHLEKANSLIKKASDLKQSDEIDEAIKNYENAIESCEKMDDSLEKNNKISGIKTQINQIYAEKADPLIKKGDELIDLNVSERALSELKNAEEITNEMHDSELKNEMLNKIGRLMNPLLLKKTEPIKEKALEIIQQENYEESVNIVNEAAAEFKKALDLAHEMIDSEMKTKTINEISGLIDNVCTAGINVRKKKGQELKEDKKYIEAVSEMYSALSIAKNMACPEEDNKAIDDIKNFVNEIYSGQINEILEEGKELLEEKEYDKALKKFDNALSISNKMYVSEKMDQTVKKVNELLREAEIKKLISEGSLMVQQKEFSKELEALQKALEDADKITDLTRKRVKIREIKDAIDQVHSKEIKFLNEQALSLTDQDKFEDGYVEFEKAIEIAKTIENEELQEEERRNIIKLYTEELNKEAKKNLKNKNFDKAIQSCKHAIDLDEDYPEPYYNMGNAYIGKKEYEQAIDFYKKAVNLAPKHINAWCDMGLAYELKNDLKKALESCNRALEINDEFSVGWYRIGNVYTHMNDVEKAIESYKKATEINPQLAKAWLFLGRLYIQKNEYHDGIEFIKKAIELNSEIKEEIKPDVDKFDELINSITEKLLQMFKNKQDK
ncbi:MAG: tetratricopeptide repeat protein [Promethearchaeota archaeon]|nr:MAG: tetratricopeptide repeat protein [Candidatus Lokiarchaeota archaeon]